MSPAPPVWKPPSPCPRQAHSATCTSASTQGCVGCGSGLCPAAGGPTALRAPVPLSAPPGQPSRWGVQVFTWRDRAEGAGREAGTGVSQDGGRCCDHSVSSVVCGSGAGAAGFWGLRRWRQRRQPRALLGGPGELHFRAWSGCCEPRSHLLAGCHMGHPHLPEPLCSSCGPWAGNQQQWQTAGVAPGATLPAVPPSPHSGRGSSALRAQLPWTGPARSSRPCLDPAVVALVTPATSLAVCKGSWI